MENLDFPKLEKLVLMSETAQKCENNAASFSENKTVLKTILLLNWPILFVSTEGKIFLDFLHKQFYNIDYWNALNPPLGIFVPSILWNLNFVTRASKSLHKKNILMMTSQLKLKQILISGENWRKISKTFVFNAIEQAWRLFKFKSIKNAIGR